MTTERGFTDIVKVCRNCTRTFTISASEQAWFAQRDMQLPARCRPCRVARRNANNGPRPPEHTANRMVRPFLR